MREWVKKGKKIKNKLINKTRILIKNNKIVN